MPLRNLVADPLGKGACTVHCDYILYICLKTDGNNSKKEKNIIKKFGNWWGQEGLENDSMVTKYMCQPSV